MYRVLWTPECWWTHGIAQHQAQHWIMVKWEKRAMNRGNKRGGWANGAGANGGHSRIRKPADDEIHRFGGLLKAPGGSLKIHGGHAHGPQKLQLRVCFFWQSQQWCLYAKKVKNTWKSLFNTQTVIWRPTESTGVHLSSSRINLKYCIQASLYPNRFSEML